MSSIQNEKGVALVTSLMFTMLSLVISMSLLYMVLSGTKSTGALKRYRSAVDASYGGTEIMLKDIITTSFTFSDYSAAHPGVKSFPQYMVGSMGLLSPNATVSDCFRQHLTLPSTKWTGACANTSFNPKTPASDADVTFRLNASSGAPYAVYSKIVNTMERKFVVLDNGTPKTVVMAGNSDASSFVLDGGSTTEGAGVTVPHYPYVYRIEVQGQSQQNAQEKANISVLYAY